ncbi:hypothetical protein AAII07_54905 [Microvirga sp. 0TCS3.31]
MGFMRAFLTPLITKVGPSGISFLLRLASLVGKFGLTLYLAQFLSLDDLGLYGIVFALSNLAVVVYGGRIDHDLSRLLVSKDRFDAGLLLRDQSIFFFFNYVASIPIVLIGQIFFPGSGLLLLLACVICWLESYANFLYVNTNALGKSVIANAVFFVRSGLWPILVIVAGLAFPSLRNLWFVLVFWALGTGLSIILSLRYLDALDWPSMNSVAIDWSPIKSALRRDLPIWLGSMGLVGGSYLDRFVLGAYLDLKAVGLATFYISFSTSLVTLVTSSVMVVAVPRLIDNAQRREFSHYNRDLRNSGIKAAAVGGVLALGISIMIPFLADLMRKPEIREHVLALWLIMGGTWLRVVAEAAFYGLYSRHKDKSIWIGNIFFLVVSFLLNLIFVPLLGLTGLGLSSLLANAALLLLRVGGLRPLTP